mmetsp:Transcript_12592/g.29800  ORF Transcript_12592/g.29800 Transcript_12592/m.29800 type:complete len:1023 (-) Transcript_12592:20-3088(-)|eukprot:CAMPEP_0197182140 /NCGR_PEP_ID=MMETSP1423-20130617/6197_1 /TAXON_ID=476441 /ORGANISM="Pseudo-nitzschia heimii, Strain UNC1101" /LENGTH=1022 /DNA_ID=CAMNT_0042632515 /DNA_START=45 /DNA_END=3113 /DNA_ORIENTATION=+
MNQNNDENQPLNASLKRSPRPGFDYFYGSTTAVTTPLPSVNNDEQESLVGEELISTDNECETPTNGDDDDSSYQKNFLIDNEGIPNLGQRSTKSLPNKGFQKIVAPFTSILIFLFMASVVSISLLIVDPPKQRKISPETQTFNIPFPQVDRADFDDPVDNFLDMDLFSSRLIRDDISINTAGTASTNGASSTSQQFSFPFPTGAFWTNLVVKPPMGSTYSFPTAVYPFAYRWSSSSLQVSYPAGHRIVEAKKIQDIFIPELTLTTKEEITNRHVVDYDPLSVTLRFSSSSSQDASVETVLVQGSPYITLTYKKQTPILHPRSTFSDVFCPGDESDNIVDLLQENGDKGGRDLFGVCKIDKSDPKYSSMRGVQFILKTPEGVNWFMFASEPIDLLFDKLSMTTISATTPFTGVIRLAYIPQSSDGSSKSLESSTGLKRLIYHSDVYPVGANLSYQFHRSGSSSSSSSSLENNPINGAKDNAIVTFTFVTRSMLGNSAATKASKTRNLLMLALPHHAGVISKSNLLDSVSFDVKYMCMKGQMIPVIGSTWTLDEPLYDISIDGPTQGVEDDIREYILQQVDDDLEQILPSPTDNIYGYGKAVARLAQLAHIADKFQRKGTKDGKNTSGVMQNDILSKASKLLLKYLEMYLSSEVSDDLLFDKNLGGLCSRNGMINIRDDFGNGRYNDHHFHYGYYLYASAIMAKLDPSFIDRFGVYVDAIFNDVAHYSHGNSQDNESDIMFFPLSRHKSWFDGHSFATGLFPFADGKSQESSSEAVNCYYGAYLWSLIRHNGIGSDITDFSRLLLSTEIRSAKTYWHMLPSSVREENNSSSPQIYPPVFEENYMVGNVGMLDVTASTWFGDDPLYVHMINCIPITAVSRLLLDEDYIKHEYPFLMGNRENVEMAWRGYTVSVHSIIDPNMAWKDASALTSNQLDSALSKSQVLYFISQQSGFNVTLNDDVKQQQQQQQHLNNSSKRKIPSFDNATKLPSTPSSRCESNPSCVQLNLEGMCCPTLAGFFLDCCSD